MKKYFYLVVFLFNIIFLNSISNYGCIFSAIEPSSINRAIGMTTGSVNIWHENPFMNCANPAIGSFHEGFSFSFINDKWFEEVPGLNKMYYDASMISYGYRGISVIFPFYNGSKANEKFGLTMDYGNENIVDENGNVTNNFNAYESSQTYGLSFNFTKIYCNFVESDFTFLNHFDLAVGANFVAIKSVLSPNSENFNGTADGTKLDIGTIAKFSYIFNNNINFEAVYGLSHHNVGKSDISYGHEIQKDIIYRDCNQGFAGSVSLLSKGFLSEDHAFFENIFCLRYLHSVENNFQDSPDIVGYGCEIGFFDTVFIRKGYYDDTAGSVKGQTFGIGINLHYKKMIAITYNYSEFPGGELQNSQDSSDFGISSDFIEIYNFIRN